MNDKKKPKYNAGQNTWFMVKTANGVCKSVLMLVLVQVLLGVLTNVAELFVAPALLQTVQTVKTAGELMTVILLFAVGFILLDAGKAYVNENTMFGRVHIRLCLVNAIAKKMMTTSFPNTEDPNFLKQRDSAYEATYSNGQAAEAIWNTLTELLKNGICFLLWLSLLSTLNPLLIGITLITSCASFGITKYLYGWEYRNKEERERYDHEIIYAVNQARNYRLAKDLRIFGMGPWLSEVFHRSLRLCQCFFNRGERLYFIGDVCSVLLGLMSNGLAYGYLIWQVLCGSIDAVAFLLYFTALGNFTEQITGILDNLLTLHRQSMDISRVREYLESEELFAFGAGVPFKADPEKEYTLELQNVSFRYPGALENTIKNLSLKIKAKEKLAIVGLNGAGKTTLVKLLCGFYDPTEGSVLFNGKDIRSYNRQDYYEHFSAVFQKSFLIAGTIAENIAQTDGEPDMERVISCAVRSGFADKAEALPKGYETKLEKTVYTDAVELSGGEMQRLLMARALYKNAPIMVLDEPTAALDPIAENDIYQKYCDLTQDRTSIFISHRLASTRFCDRIILLENGVIAEEGTHEQLMKKKCHYAELFELQSRYYKEENADEYF